MDTLLSSLKRKLLVIEIKALTQRLSDTYPQLDFSDVDQILTDIENESSDVTTGYLVTLRNEFRDTLRTLGGMR